MAGFFERAAESESRLKKSKRPMKKFAVFGNPIAHSVSPTIHQMFAKSCGEDIGYEKILVPLDSFAEALESFFSDPAGSDSLFHQTLDRAFKDTSAHVLSVLFSKYKFLDHISAMRKYLLLGQGDIIR